MKCCSAFKENKVDLAVFKLKKFKLTVAVPGPGEEYIEYFTTIYPKSKWLFQYFK